MERHHDPKSIFIYKLSTGRKFKAHAGCLSLTNEETPRLCEGYDGYVNSDYDYDESELTADEKKEIARYMINMWQDWGGL